MVYLYVPYKVYMSCFETPKHILVHVHVHIHKRVHVGGAWTSSYLQYAAHRALSTHLQRESDYVFVNRNK